MSEIAIDSQSASPSTIPASDDSGMPRQVVEVANDKQEWEIFALHLRYQLLLGSSLGNSRGHVDVMARLTNAKPVHGLDAANE